VDEKLLNRIISVAYGDASLWEKIKIHRLANKNPEIKSLLDEYTKVANTAHDLKLEECPVEILNEIKEVTSTRENRENSLLYDIYSFVFRRPAISGAILGVFIIALISTFIIKRPEIHQQYSKHEIEQADLQVKHSLALIAEVFKKTSLTVEKDVLTNRVSKPIKESFNLVNDYLQGENNESIN
jgi:hypothetical protein